MSKDLTIFDDDNTYDCVPPMFHRRCCNTRLSCKNAINFCIKFLYFFIINTLFMSHGVRLDTTQRVVGFDRA